MTKEDFKDLRMFAEKCDKMLISDDLTFEDYEAAIKELNDNNIKVIKNIFWRRISYLD